MAAMSSAPWRRRVALVALLGTVASLLTGCFSAPPQIISLDPNRGSTGVYANAPITVIFDRPVDHESVARNFDISPNIQGCDEQAAFHASPAAPCYVTWLTDQSGFAFQHPGAVFTPNTTYTVRLRAGVADTRGVVNGIDHTWDLTTGNPPTVATFTPADGVVVPRDSPIAVNFNTGMMASTTYGAIHLDPAVPDTRVERNVIDHGRFVVLPGHLLQPDTTYTLTIDTSATDEHGAHLDRRVVAHFRTTEALLPTPHVVVLAGRSGEGATEVLLSAPAPTQPGEPIPVLTYLTAPRCDAPGGCGGVAPGAPLVTFRAAELAPGGRWLALVERDAATGERRLRIMDLRSDSDRSVIPGGGLPSWSPDGGTVAFAAAGDVRLYQPLTDQSTTLPPGAPLASPAVWTGDGTSIALPVATPSGDRVELATPALAARYPLPGVAGALTAPVAAPQGSVIACLVPGATPSTLLLDLSGGATDTLGRFPGVVPVALLDSGTLLAAQASGTLVRIDLGSGGIVPLAGASVEPALVAGVAASSDRRQIAYPGPDPIGTLQAIVSNADGSNSRILTTLAPGSEVDSITWGG